MRYYTTLLLSFIIFSCHTDVDKAATWNPRNGASDHNGALLKSSGLIVSEEMEVQEAVYDLNAPPRPTSQESSIEAKIIKNATLRFETDDLEKTHNKIQQLVTSSGGYFQHDNTGKNYNAVFHNLTVRVPSKNFDLVLAGISEGVAYFEEKNISQRNVTEEFIDLNARLKTKRELENRYLALLRQAKDVKDMLQIERELSKIREEIEAKQGRLQYLQHQVNESTLHIYFYKITAEKGVTVSYGRKIVNALQNGFQGLSSFFLGLLGSWPLVLFLITGLFVGRRWVKKWRKRTP